VVLPRSAVGAAVLIPGVPPPVSAEAATHSSHRAHGARLLLGPLLDLWIPDLADGGVAAAGSGTEQVVQARTAAGDHRIVEGPLHLMQRLGAQAIEECIGIAAQPRQRAEPNRLSRPGPPPAIIDVYKARCTCLHAAALGQLRNA